jgi:hypothetical protein
MKENRWMAWVRRLRQGSSRVSSTTVGLTMIWRRRRAPRIMQMTTMTRRFARTTIVRVLAALHIEWPQRSRSRMVVTNHAPRAVGRVKPSAEASDRVGLVPRVHAVPTVAPATEGGRGASDGYARKPPVSESAVDPAVPRVPRTQSRMQARSRGRRISPLLAEPVLRTRRVATRLEQMPADRPSLLIRAPGRGPERGQVAVSPRTSFESRGREEQVPWSAVAVPGVDALTDEVIRQIDRRVIAQRERLGRV